MSSERWHEKAGDFVVGLFSPTRAALRRHWRRVERDEPYRHAYELALRLRGYKAARSDKNTTPWLDAANRSADAEILGDLPKLRARCRSLARDDSIGSGIVGTRKRAIVGTGLRPQAQTADETKNEALEAVWRERCDKLSPADGYLSHAGHQEVLHCRTDEDGEVLVRPAKDGPLDPVWFETIESDRLVTPMDATPPEGGRIADGVEKDRFGRPVAYWVAKRHPGDTASGQTKLGSKVTTSPVATTVAQCDRIPVDGVYHKRSRVTRAGQTRGVPLFHAVLQDIHDLDLLILASLKRTQVAACLALFIKSDAQASDLIELTAEDYGYQLDQKLEPGMFFRLFPGESVETLAPNFSAPDLDKFVFLLARRIGAAVGMSPQAVLRAWEGINYSGARTIKIDDRQTTRCERAALGHCLSWEWLVVQGDALLRGDPRLVEAGVTIEDLGLVVWIGDEEQWVDPAAEADAIEVMLALSLTTVQDECAKLGKDWRENLRKKLEFEKAEKEMRAELGLEAAPSEPLKVVKGGKQKPADEDEKPAKEVA